MRASVPEGIFQDSNLLPTRLYRHVPERPDSNHLLEIVASKVHDFEVQNIFSIFRELYKKYYNLGFVVLGRPVDKTAAKKIVAICKLRDWPLRDYVEYNVLWFKRHSKYRALPSHLCGQAAESKYEAFLREEGYIDEHNTSARKRKEEIAQQEAVKHRTEDLRLRNLLPEQAEDAACRYADMEASKVSTPANDLPAWLRLTPEQAIERNRQKVWAAAKAEYMEGWRRLVSNGSAQGR